MARQTLLIVAALASCGSESATTGSQPELRQLSTNEISSELRGKLVSYSPPGSADAGVHEEYHSNGRWEGVRYGRGPFPFAGRWKVQKNQLCVRSESGLSGSQWERGWVCRNVWKSSSGKLLMPHLTPGLASQLGAGLMKLSVRQLP
jgi:hypothetical protein